MLLCTIMDLLRVCLHVTYTLCLIPINFKIMRAVNDKSPLNIESSMGCPVTLNVLKSFLHGSPSGMACRVGQTPQTFMGKSSIHCGVQCRVGKQSASKPDRLGARLFHNFDRLPSTSESTLKRQALVN